MHVILLALGIAAIAAGGVMLGFGIAISEFGLGNALIMAGTTAVIGGLIVVALAIAVRLLTRIATRLEATEPAPAPVVTPDAQLRGWVEPIPVAVVPVPAAAAARASAAAAEPDQPRLPDHPPLQRELLLREPPPQREPPSLSRGPARTKGAEQGTTGNAEPTGTTRQARSARGEIPVVLSPRERSFDRPAEPAPAERREVVRGDDRPGGAPRSQPAVSILKSGVIDGMAYTIYSDGSIEAELPQGTMRFTTFEELRVYLADAG
ncbi:MAG: hypothetical protein ABSG76_24935 [Xanthobacteraceae bacterium]|jgi:hypothetical protein